MMVRADCPVGQYNDGSGCQYCPVGQTTTDGTATSVSECASPFQLTKYAFSCPSGTACYRSEISFDIVDSNGNIIVSGSSPDFGANDGTSGDPVTFTVPATGTYTLNMADSYGDGWHGAKIHITNNDNIEEYGGTFLSGATATAQLDLTAPTVAPCSVGEYGEGTCTTCPAGTTDGTGALFAYDCVDCSDGQILSGRTCSWPFFTSGTELETAISECETAGWGSGSCVPNFWDVSQVTDMSYVFKDKTSFNENISSWDVSSVTKMLMMFDSASAFNQPLNNWDVSKVTDMNYVFYGASSFNQPLDAWDVSSVTAMQAMFSGASSFNQPLDSWDVSSVQHMYEMFKGASSFDQSLSCWDFNFVMSYQGILSDTPAKTRYHYVKTENFDPGSEMPNSLDKNIPCSDCTTDLPTCTGNQLLGHNGTCYVCRNPADCDPNQYDDGSGCQYCPVGQTSDGTAISEAGCASPFEDSGITPCNVGEYGYGNCTTCPAGTTDGTGALFVYDCVQCLGGQHLEGRTCKKRVLSSRTELVNAISECETAGWGSGSCVPNDWDVSQVTYMHYLFHNKNTFNENISSWDVSSVITIYGMFLGASAFNQPLNNWDVSKVTDMQYVFSGASSFNQPLNNWNVASVTNMQGMFNDASAFNQPLNDWDVSKVTSMRLMFREASSFNQPVNNWNVSSVTNMLGLFHEATSFDQSLSCWDFQNPIKSNILRDTPAKLRYHYVKTENFDPGSEMPNSQNKNSTCSDCGLTCTGDEFVYLHDTCYVCYQRTILEDALDACAANNWGTVDCILNIPDQAILDEWQRRHGTCGSS